MNPSVVRRLNNTEYNNTVQDLLGDTTQPANGFPPDSYEGGFDNNADILSISQPLLQSYFDAAQALVANAMANPTVQAQIVTCSPSSVPADACAGQILGAFGARAWRRPLDSSETASLVQIVTSSLDAGDAFPDALGAALSAVLTSSKFLYRPEIDPPGTVGVPHPLDDYELASRLSYFIWGSMPDDALFAAAAAGQLEDRSQLEGQARRMLQDPKAARLLDQLAGEWLGTRGVESANPSPAVYPSYSLALRSAMEGETREVLQAFFDQDKDLTGLFGANFTYADDVLAADYGLSAITGSSLIQVPLTGTRRGGILTHGAFLTATSMAARPSPTRRGKWVLNRFLCQYIAPPPPNVPQLQPPTNTSGTFRQQMEGHETDPSCAACHGLTDPIGFTMENFDGIGGWRDTDNGLPIDATGHLPGGPTVNGVLALEAQLQANPEVPKCMGQTFWTFALGRVPTAQDMPAIDLITRAAQAQGTSLREFVLQIVLSDSFRNRIGQN